MLSLDPTTQTALEAATTPTARAAAILASVSGAITVTVYDGAGVVKGTGTMASLGTQSANVIVLSNTSDFEVTASGSPDPASWTIKFENGSGRWVKGTFGLSSQPTAEFTWSLDNWTIASTGSIANAYLTVRKQEVLVDVTDSYNVVPLPTNTAPYWLSNTPISLTLPLGATYDFSQHAADANSDPLSFSLIGTQYTGITMSPAGVLTIGDTAVIATRNLQILVVDPGGLSATWTCTVQITAAFTADFIIPANVSSWNAAVAQPRVTGGTAVPNSIPNCVVMLSASNSTTTGTSGTRGPLTIQNVTQTSPTRMTVIPPSGGVVTIRSPTIMAGGFVFVLQNCNGLTVNGRHSSGARECGIKVTYAANAVAGIGTANKDHPSSFIKFSKLVRNTTIQYCEVDGGWIYDPAESQPATGSQANGKGWAYEGIGISGHEDTYKAIDHPNEWYENNKFLYNYFHNTQGEAMYIGSNYSTAACPLRNIENAYNWIEDCGGGGAHAKCWLEGNNSVHHNTVIHCGFGAPTPSRIGLTAQATTARFYNNYIYEIARGSDLRNDASGGRPDGIQCTTVTGPYPNQLALGLYGPYPTFDVWIYNNVVVRPGDPSVQDVAGDRGNGISIGRGSDAGGTYSPYKARIFNNTLISGTGVGININNPAAGTFVKNNIVLGFTNGGAASPTQISASSVTGYSAADNKITGVITDVFQLPSGADPVTSLTLKAAVPAVGTVNATEGPIATTDYLGTSRATGTADMGAYERA